jgi:hypothetical protein
LDGGRELGAWFTGRALKERGRPAVEATRTTINELLYKARRRLTDGFVPNAATCRWSERECPPL